MPVLLPFVAAALLLAGAVPPARAADPPLPSPIVVDGTPVPWQDVAADGSAQIHLYFGWTSTCPHCAKARPFIAQLASEWPWLRVHSFQIDGDSNAANVAFVVGLADAVGEPFRAVPAFFYDGRMETGFDEATTTGVELRAALLAYHGRVVRDLTPVPSATGASSAAGGTPATGASPVISPIASPAASPGATAGASPAVSPEATPRVQPIAVPFLGTVDVASLSLPAVTVVLAGLDAVNPCALSVLLFLLSLLVGSRSRARMLTIGGAFVLVSGLAYFLFMAAWLNVFLLTGGLRIVTIVAGAAALVAATINIKDFVWFRRGVSLVIPESAKPRIFGRMIDLTERTQFSALLGGTILVAIAANAYEALCTGGFPVVFTRILTLHQLSTGEYYWWLAAYSLVYVAPLFVIVAAFTWTLGHHTVTITEARRLKLLSGLLMFGLGLMLLFAPERLGDFTASIAVFASATAAWAVAVLVDRRRSAATRKTPQPPQLPRGSHGHPDRQGPASEHDGTARGSRAPSSASHGGRH